MIEGAAVSPLAFLFLFPPTLFVRVFLWGLVGCWKGVGKVTSVVTCWTIGQHPKVRRFLGGVRDESPPPRYCLFLVFIEVRLCLFLG